MISNYPYPLWRCTHSPFGGVPIPLWRSTHSPFGGVTHSPFGVVPIPPLEEYPFPFGGVPIPLWRDTHSPFGGGRGRFYYKILIKKAMYLSGYIAFFVKIPLFLCGEDIFLYICITKPNNYYESFSYPRE